VVHPDDRETLESRAGPNRRTGCSVRIGVPRGLAGRKRPLHHGPRRLVRDDQGRPASINGVTWDITEGKHTEQALQESADDSSLFWRNVGRDVLLLRTARCGRNT